MDVNGTRFHLVYDRDDWGQVFLIENDDVVSDRPVYTAWDTNTTVGLSWNATDKSLQLSQLTPIFRRAREKSRLPLSNRRGADRDQYGNWYWINAEQDGIHFLAINEHRSVSFWRAADMLVDCDEAISDDFKVRPPPAPPEYQLVGLAVTTNHYLVTGHISDTERGLLIFDLHRGGPPTLLTWPTGVKFEPWDIAATPDGGLLILDGKHNHYWRLDEHFRLSGEITDEPAIFQPHDVPDDASASELPNRAHRRHVPKGFPLDDTVIRPISIESGPDGVVLILDTPEDVTKSSSVHEYDGATYLRTMPIDDIPIGATPSNDETLAVRGLDFAVVACRSEDQCVAAPSQKNEIVHMLYIVEERGNQTIAFEMDREQMELDPRPDFLPMRRWGEKALVAAGTRVYYDFEERWIPLQVFDDCHYSPRSGFVTPPDFSDRIPEQPFDSNIPDCIWHRLIIDADIPANTNVYISARAANDPESLTQTKWIDQPNLYLRHSGAELPYYDPFSERRYQSDRQSLVRYTDTNCTADKTLLPLTDRTGTWEILFQHIRGRYIQLRITLEGTGRSTPSLYTMRLWYPRFSYSENYLPAIYREDPPAASFLERWLANCEGIYTYIEDSIEQVYHLFDPRTAPIEALEWLAGWMGLILDPLWSEEKRRFFIRHAYDLHQIRGTVPGLRAAIRMYVEDDLTDQIFDLTCNGDSPVRIVERFLVREVAGVIYGDTSDQQNTNGQTKPLTKKEREELRRERVSQNAHRFTVLLPHNLTFDDDRMVQRIIEMEKPTHTSFTLQRYWDLFRVGEARLGLDTQLGHSSYFVPQMLGDTYLADGYLAYSYPYNVENRLVMGRDSLGDMPEL